MGTMIRLAAFTVAAVVGVGVVSAQAVCPRCGRVHVTTNTPAVGAVSLASDVSIQLAEAKRRAAGLGPLRYVPHLMNGARIKATTAARRGFRGHLGGSFYGGNKEGVGWSTNQSANACYLLTAPAGTPAGVAVVRGRGGWYTCLLIDYPGPLASGRTGGPVRRVFRRFRR